jgi:hypothetical protein
MTRSKQVLVQERFAVGEVVDDDDLDVDAAALEVLADELDVDGVVLDVEDADLQRRPERDRGRGGAA